MMLGCNLSLFFQNSFDQCVPTYKHKEKKSLYSNCEVFSLKQRRSHIWKRYLSAHSTADLSNFKSVNVPLCVDSSKAPPVP